MNAEEAERDFISRIDNAFPYQDPATAWRLVIKGCIISPNSAFMVAHELAPPGLPPAAPVELRLEYLELLRAHFRHPLAKTVLDITERRIHGEFVPVEEALALMDVIGEYAGLYNALGIAYDSCDDPDGLVDERWEAITERWRRLGR
jgi:hypothetical protein